MRTFWIVVALLALLLIPVGVVAEELKPLELSDEKAVVEYKPVEASVVDQLLDILGLKTKPVYNSAIEVFVNEKRLAIVPNDSPLIDLEIHSFCLETYQYGTRAFIVCEETI